ncbi:MAG TPA: hypothetical protein VG097_15855, partial [Gemmata sp.]|nr:hypothetical protein [Gemmata sp.]
CSPPVCRGHRSTQHAQTLQITFGYSPNATTPSGFPIRPPGAKIGRAQFDPPQQRQLAPLVVSGLDVASEALGEISATEQY